MNPLTLQTLRNYSQQHIYNIIISRYKTIPEDRQLIKVKSKFKELVSVIRFLTTTTELNVINTPMSFIFQHLKPCIINLVANCQPNCDRDFISRGLIYNFDWCIRFFNCLVRLGAKDLVIWFFLHIPYFNPDSLIIDKQRQIYEKMMDYLYDNMPPDMFPTEVEFFFISNQTCMPYAISYHNKNNVAILQKYCRLIRKICPWVNYYSPRLAERLMKKQPLIDTYSGYRRRICFISDSFATDTSVLRDRVSIIGKLDRNLYDVWFASFIPYENIKGNVAKLFMGKIKANYIYLGKSLENARNILEPYKFDFLVYPDIGMKLTTTLLAYSRISPIQITTWGHSETSGIDTIDYYISSKYFELEVKNENKLNNIQPQSNYSEKLILMDSLSTFYISPHKLFIELNEDCKDKKMKTKEELGFKSTDNLYACLQTFYKINPEFENCMARILELDPNGIILLSNTYPYCRSHLARIRQTLGEAKLCRIRFYGSLEKSEFLNLVSVSSVCLDPFPFGGCNTSYDAFDYNVPVITMPSDFLHGRFTYGLYKKMGLQECIVSNVEEYAQLAAKIAINEKLRHKINRNIEMRKNLIFQEQESVNEWNKLFTYLE